MENRSLDHLMQNQVKEEKNPHSWANCSILCLLGILVNLLLTLSLLFSLVSIKYLIAFLCHLDLLTKQTIACSQHNFSSRRFDRKIRCLR